MWALVVLESVEHPSRQRIEQSSRLHLSRRDPSVMENRGACKIDGTVAALTRAPREVDLLEKDEETFVETTELIEQRSPDQKKRANDLVHVTSGATFIGRQVMRF